VTKTVTKTETTETFEPLQTKTRALSPLLILDVGSAADGVLRRVNVVEDEENSTKRRTFYEMRLLAVAKGEDKDGNKYSPDAGELVTIPGTGGLDYNMKAIVREVAKLLEHAKVEDWSPVYGHRFIFTRKGDEKMSRGKHAGKPVKCWDVGHAAPKAKA